MAGKNSVIKAKILLSKQMYAEAILKRNKNQFCKICQNVYDDTDEALHLMHLHINASLECDEFGFMHLSTNPSK